jgi:hypothetical protein
MLSRLTVVVCLITDVPLDITLPVRVPLRKRVAGIRLPAQAVDSGRWARDRVGLRAQTLPGKRQQHQR